MNVDYVNNKYVFSGYKVLEDENGRDLELLTKDTIEARYFSAFRNMLYNEENAVAGESLSLSPQTITDYYSKKESPLKSFEQFINDFKFPPINNTRRPLVQLEGTINNKDSYWKVVYPEKITSFGPVGSLNLRLEGFVLYYPSSDKIYGTCNLRLIELTEKIKEINSHWKNDSLEDRYLFFITIKEYAEKAGAALTDSLKDYKVVEASKIKPIIEKTDKGFEIKAGIVENIDQDAFSKSINSRVATSRIVTIAEPDGGRTKVILSEAGSKVIDDIKGMSNASQEKVKEFLENPPENWNDEIVDTSELYSDRVIGWKLYIPKITFNKQDSDWFEDADNAVSDKMIAFKCESHDKKEVKILDIKDNEDTVNYETENQDFIKSLHFPNIPGGYKSPYSPKEYQKEGIAWLYSAYNQDKGCILADDMGLGKTFQVLSFLQAVSKNNLTVLIVTQASLLEVWRDEYYKFFNEINYDIRVASRNDIRRLLNNQINKKEKNSTIYITSYETIRSCKEYIQIQWDIVILDEAQKIKNPTSLTNRTCRALKSNFNVACTGTPVENTFSDIWAITDFINPGLLGSHKEFKENYKVLPSDSDEDVRIKGQKIRETLGHCFLRRSKENNLKDLPKKTFIKQECLMPAQQESYYKAVLKKATGKISFAERLSLIRILKQVSDHHSYVAKDIDFQFTKDETARTILLYNILCKIKEKNEKVIIFAEFIKTQDILATIIQNTFGFTPDIFNGSVNALGRTTMLNRFKRKEGFNIIIMSPIAAGVGLTITEANHVIHFSRLWNPAKEDQATDRAYRIGQTKEVFVYTLIGKINGITTFDEKLDRLLTRKQTLKGAALYPSNRLEVTQESIL